MFGSLFKVVTDVVSIATAPVQIAADLTRVITKPLADASSEVAKAVEESVQDITK